MSIFYFFFTHKIIYGKLNKLGKKKEKGGVEKSPFILTIFHS